MADLLQHPEVPGLDVDDTEPVPFARIKRVIEADLKIKDVSEVFASVDERPLATASIAQVHAAKLKSGEDVVIKVQKPGVDSLLIADLAFENNRLAGIVLLLWVFFGSA